MPPDGTDAGIAVAATSESSAGSAVVSGSGVSGDLDCTTDASPTTVLQIVESDATAVWTQGRRFGTIGCVMGGALFRDNHTPGR